MKKEIEQVTLSMIISNQGIIDRLKKGGIQVLLETDEMVAASNSGVVEKRGEKFASRLGEGKQGRADSAGRIIFDGGKCITPKKGIAFVSPKGAINDLGKLGFSLFDVYLKIKEGDNPGKAFLHVKLRRGKDARNPLRFNNYQMGLISPILRQTYAKMTGFNNESRTHKTPPRWYGSEPKNITYNFIAYAVTRPAFRKKYQHKFKILRITEENEFYSCPLVA